jgi:surface carbohydrate biosynthesis protein (TIGR04326 family)
MLIWDSTDSPPMIDRLVYCWNGYVEKDCQRSIFAYIENNAERLRSKYLAWIYDLGEWNLGNRRLIDHLAFEDGMSFWWMTPFVEKSYHKFPIADALRLLAIEEIIKKEKPEKIKLVTAKRWLHQTIKNLCASQQIKYQWEKIPSETKALSREKIYNSLPQPCQALFALVRQWRVASPFRKSDRAGWFDSDENALFICGYFANLQQKKADGGHFQSYYWGGLTNLIRQLGVKGNWLHHNSAFPSSVALNWVGNFNKNEREDSFHGFLNAYLSKSLVFRVLRKWVKLSLVSLGLRKIKSAFIPQGTCVSLWPLLQKCWKSSLRGSFAVDGLLSMELFDAALGDIPRQKKGIYLCENNRWERALNYAWRKHDHGELIAVPHSTVRFWDLRYFADPRTYQSDALGLKVEPDRVALNGRAAQKAYFEANYPETRTAECEALRYEHLHEAENHSRSKIKNEATKVLLLGDFLYLNTIRLLRLIDEAVPQLGSSYVYTFKPHPVCVLTSKDVFKFSFETETRPLSEIVSRFDLVVSSNSTSAGVDAFFAGLPVVVMLDDQELNYSPLRDQPGVKFVSTAQDTIDAFQAVNLGSSAKQNPDGFFFLDPSMSKWRELLSSTLQQGACH